MNEHFIHLESPSSLRRLPYFILSDFDAFWHGIVIDQKSGISWPSPIKNDTFFKTIKIFLLWILNEWKGNYPILCSMQHFCPRLDIFFAPTSAHRRRLMDALRHFLGIRHISVFGLFEWSQHHNLHLKRLQCKKIQSSRFFWALLTIPSPPHYSLMLLRTSATLDYRGRSIQSRLVSRITIHKGSSSLQKSILKNEDVVIFCTYRLHIELWRKGVKISMRG